MKVFQSISLATRKLSILLTILLLVSAALFLYYFKYVPDNKLRLQKQGFLLLHQQQRGIEQALEDFKKYFCSKYKIYKNTPEKNEREKPESEDSGKYNKIFESEKRVTSRNVTDSHKKINSKVNIESTSITEEKTEETENKIKFTVSTIQEQALQYQLKYFEKQNQQDDHHPESIDCIQNVFFDLHGQSSIIFQFEDSTGIFQFILPFKQLFDKILDPGKLELFQSYIVICSRHADPEEKTNHKAVTDEEENHSENHSHLESHHVLYHSPGLSLSEQLPADSLGSLLATTLFSKMVNIKIDGNPYKAFILPFQLEHNTLLLSGIVPDKDYLQRLQQIPFNLVSLLLIVFIFILISLPYIKIFFISREEHISVGDIGLAGISMFMGTAIILIILQQLLMQTGAQLRTKNKLIALSDSVNKYFHTDIIDAYRELRYLDSSLNQDIELYKLYSDTNKHVAQEKLEIKILTDTNFSYYLPYPKGNTFINYELVHWADSSGQQIYKGIIGNKPFSFSTISHRQYFQDVKSAHLLSYPREGIESFSIEPVFSISTNRFEVNIAIPSRIEHAKMAALSAYMSSVMNTITQRGYGFYIIDETGLIQFQSKGNVTLMENLIEWINDPGKLTGAIKNRQTRYLKNLYINDKECNLFIKPLDQLPLYLVAYHCNDYYTSSILNIHAFILFFVMMLYGVLLLYFLFIWSNFRHPSRLNQYIHQYDWVKPGSSKSHFYITAYWYMGCYFLIVLLFSIFSGRDSDTWFNGFSAPLFVVWGLHILYSLNRNHSNISSIVYIQRLIKIPYLINLFPLVLLVFADITYFSLETNPFPRIRVFIFQGISIPPVIMILSQRLRLLPGVFSDILPAKSKLKKIIPKRIITDISEINKTHYTLFLFFSVLSVSILPVYCFFRYAQQNEIALQIKADQLDLTEMIENRLSEFNWLDTVVAKRNISDRQLKDSILFNRGIYYDGSITRNNKPGTTPNSILIKPYDQIIQYINWGYRSMNTVLTDKDSASDGQWERQDNDGSLMTLVYGLSSQKKKPDKISTVDTLRISDRLPSVFEFYRMDNSMARILVLFFSILLMALLYYLIRSLVKQLFPDWKLKHMENTVKHADNLILGLMNKGNVAIYNSIREVLKQDITNNDKKFELLLDKWNREYSDNRKDKNNTEIQEDDILFNQYQLKPLYEELWKSCSGKEKYFLYDMSRDGFINPKKVQLIQNLYFKGLVTKDSKVPGMKIISVSFRNFILDKGGENEIANLKNKYHIRGTWAKIKTPVLVSITAISIFLFITQEDLLQRVAALVPTLTALFGLGSIVLGSKSSGGDAK